MIVCLSKVSVSWFVLFYNLSFYTVPMELNSDILRQYVYMYVYMYVYRYVYMCVYMYVYMYVSQSRNAFGTNGST